MDSNQRPRDYESHVSNNRQQTTTRTNSRFSILKHINCYGQLDVVGLGCTHCAKSVPRAPTSKSVTMKEVIAMMIPRSESLEIRLQVRKMEFQHEGRRKHWKKYTQRNLPVRNQVFQKSLSANEKQSLEQTIFLLLLAPQRGISSAG